MNDQIRSEFGVRPDHIYLDAATYGLPPASAVAAYKSAIDDWQNGIARWVEEWETAGDESRALFARLIGTDPKNICLLPSVSAGIGTVAASLPQKSIVLAAEDEFTSLILPFAGVHKINACEVQTVPWDKLIGAVSAGIDLVAVSLTRAQDGRTIDLGDLVSAASAANVRVVIDATHALPFVPVARHLDGIDYLICHGYKHLLSPRGTAFAYINSRYLDQLAPVNANWRSVHRSYGLPLGPAKDASMFDISLAWQAWVGTKPALERIVAWYEDGTVRRSLELAKRLARLLEVPEPAASLVCLPVADPERVTVRLNELGVQAAGRGNNLRLSTHVWNTEEEIDRAADLVFRVIDELGARV